MGFPGGTQLGKVCGQEGLPGGAALQGWGGLPGGERSTLSFGQAGLGQWVYPGLIINSWPPAPVLGQTLFTCFNTPETQPLSCDLGEIGISIFCKEVRNLGT